MHLESVSLSGTLAHLAFAPMRLLELLAVSPCLEILTRRPHALTDVLTCRAGC